MNEEYYIGQIFEGIYPPMAAVWCNQNGAYIKRLEDGKYEIMAVPEPAEPSYAEKRLMEYPTFGEQFDMIYWDRVNGTNLWQEKIAEIKAKYPKE